MQERGRKADGARSESPSPALRIAGEGGPSPQGLVGEGLHVSSQPEDSLGDDVLLDLVGAAVDRDLARIEIGRSDRAGPFGSNRRLVPTLVLVVLRLVRHRVGT